MSTLPDQKLLYATASEKIFFIDLAFTLENVVSDGGIAIDVILYQGVEDIA
ncbi:hypothetical protein [Taibaiella soli]|uniref:hypothetical protein n=1 Tax=Taibaiella soli TaxID=1649169 RepID=UPI001401D44A|nr:hypothetical protein [Taibaiella soli]